MVPIQVHTEGAVNLDIARAAAKRVVVKGKEQYGMMMMCFQNLERRHSSSSSAEGR